MFDMIPFNEQFSLEPTTDDYQILANEIVFAHEFRKKVDGTVAIYSGLRLIKLKEKRYGKLDQLYENIGISASTADNYVLIAKVFKDDPGSIEGLGIRKTIFMAKLPEDDIVRFKANGIWKDPEGNFWTTDQLRQMTAKELENKHINKLNQKNHEMSKVKSDLTELKIEINDMRKEYEINQKILEETINGGQSQTLYEENQKLKKRMASLNERIDELSLKLMKQSKKEFLEGEVIDAIEKAQDAIHEVFFKVENVETGYHGELRAKLLGFYQWAREYLNSRNMNFDRFLEEDEEK